MIFFNKFKDLLVLSFFLLSTIFSIKCSSNETQRNYQFVKIKEMNLIFPDGEVVGKVFDFMEHNNEFYLVDQQSHTIWVTNKNGKLKRKIGRKGKGPGDLLAPVSIAFKGDTLFVLEKDNARVSLFDEAGVFIRQFPVRSGMLSSLEISRDGKRIIIGESLGIWNYLFYSINGEQLSEAPGFKRTEISMPTSIAGGQLSVTENNNILFSGIRQYNVIMLNWEGDTIKFLSAAPENYSAPSLNNRKKLMAQKFWSIVTLPLEINNYILIQRFNKVLAADNKSKKEKNKFYYDLFSIEGKLIAEGIKSQSSQFLFQKNGLLYSIDYTPLENGKDNPSILAFELQQQ